MAISPKKLWTLLIDKAMTEVDLPGKICGAIDAGFSDIIQYIPDKK